MTNTTSSETSVPRIAVLGLGYVGCVSAACFAKLGYQVTGIDRDQIKVINVLNGTAPFYEPELDILVHDNVAAGRLTASTSIEPVVNADFAFVYVGTPPEKNGNLGLEQLRRVINEIAGT